MIPKIWKRYPRTVAEDLKMLEDTGCDLVYLPEVDDIYPKGAQENYEIDFNGLDLTMEGAFRPGHFKGVAQVVERFFRIIEPHRAYFGRKDFQQTAIIKHMVRVRSLPVHISIVDTQRNADGLALSSRNMLLSEADRKDSLIIYKTLLFAKERASQGAKVSQILPELVDFFKNGNLRLEYLEIVDDTTLKPCEIIPDSCTCCIAAYCGNIRLIDNMSLNK
jgi:pantoate--beta-alanine ligase